MRGERINKSFQRRVRRMQEPGIAVLDFGSQYTENIAKCLRELGVDAEVYEADVPVLDIRGAKGVIGSGGPASAYQAGSPRCQPAVWDMPVPKLAICYSFQAFAHDNGGQTVPADEGGRGEYGKSTLVVGEYEPIFSGLPHEQTVWMSHGDRVAKLPPGMRKLASTVDCEYAAAWDPKRNIIGVQFHPEVHETEHGKRMLDNFLNICGQTERMPWTYERFLAESPDIIRQKVAGRKVVHLASGGKDSTLAGILFNKAGVSVDCLHIDCGIERLRDLEEMEALLSSVSLKPTVLDTSAELERELYGVVDSEEKRKIIGRHFIRHAERYARKGYDVDWVIGQGSIWPDHIESKGSRFSDTIVTHHNRVQEVLELIAQGRIVEPNLHLFKEDVEGIIKVLDRSPEYAGLAKLLVKKHPFPGPGLAIRALCSKGIEPSNLDQLTEEVAAIADRHNMQARALPVLSAGVGGDARSYSPPAVIWGDNGTDWDKLERVSTDITNQLRGRVNRVVYAWMPTEIQDVQLHEAYVTKERLDRLRKADAMTMDALERSGEMGNIQQCPTISLPISINGRGPECTVIRPFVTGERKFMTGKPGRLPTKLVDQIAEGHIALGYGALVYDITHKPPGRTEWE